MVTLFFALLLSSWHEAEWLMIRHLLHSHSYYQSNDHPSVGENSVSSTAITFNDTTSRCSYCSCASPRTILSNSFIPSIDTMKSLVKNKNIHASELYHKLFNNV
jgi:hypothetical protein